MIFISDKFGKLGFSACGMPTCGGIEFFLNIRRHLRSDAIPAA